MGGMSSFIVQGLNGRKKLSGDYYVSGSKNESLPAMALAYLMEDEYRVENVPDIEDMRRMLELLEKNGFITEQEGNAFVIKNGKKISSKIDYQLGGTMRSSLMLTAGSLARNKKVSFVFPGGCKIGERPIDLTLKAYEALGAKVTRRGKVFHVEAKELRGAEIFFDKVSVTGTESAIIAASLAKGKTTILNAAMEPEVVGIGNYLKSLGLKIEGLGTPTIHIQGRAGKLFRTKGKAFQVIPDRIEAGSMLILGALLAKKLTIHGVPRE